MGVLHLIIYTQSLLGKTLAKMAQIRLLSNLNDRAITDMKQWFLKYITKVPHYIQIKSSGAVSQRQMKILCPRINQFLLLGMNKTQAS